MSFPLFNAPESFLKKKVAISTHDRQNSCEHSLKDVAAKEDCEIEAESFASEESHLSLVPGSNTECQSESGELDPDLDRLQFPIWSCGIDPLRTSYPKEQTWNGSYPTPESIKIGIEESDSDSGESESFIEELELKFGSQIHISSDTYVQRVDETRSEESLLLHECKKGQGVETESRDIDGPSIENVIGVPFSLAAGSPFSAYESTESLLPKGSGKPLLSSRSCTAGSTKLQSALRGGYEEMGLGPRSKFHVKWASSVYEPACTSASHTVLQNHRRHHAKKDHKHRHKGKISHSESHKKLVKKAYPRSRYIGEAFVLRTQAVTPQNGKYSLAEVGLTESLVLPCNERTLKSIRISSAVLPQSYSVNGMPQRGERRLVKLDAKLPFSWHVQPHRLVM